MTKAKMTTVRARYPLEFKQEAVRIAWFKRHPCKDASWYYNTRLHLTLSYFSPVQFESNWFSAQVEHANP